MFVDLEIFKINNSITYSQGNNFVQQKLKCIIRLERRKQKYNNSIKNNY